MDPVRPVLQELQSNPTTFKNGDGYARLLALLRSGCSPLAVKELLRGRAEFIGDILWTVCELDDPGPYVEEALLHASDADPGTAAYAMEVVLRGAHDQHALQMALSRLEVAPQAVREHAVLVLAGEGLTRARDVFALGGWSWAAALLGQLLRDSSGAEATITDLLASTGHERHLVGLVIATLASEHDERAVKLLEQSASEWGRSFATRLREMFQHRWKT